MIDWAKPSGQGFARQFESLVRASSLWSAIGHGPDALQMGSMKHYLLAAVESVLFNPKAENTGGYYAYEYMQANWPEIERSLTPVVQKFSKRPGAVKFGKPRIETIRPGGGWWGQGFDIRALVHFPYSVS